MQRDVKFVNNGLTLRGMMHIPEGISEKVPGVAIYHGYTGNKLEPHFMFVKLSRALEKEGIASVRFDFAGSGESDGDFKDMTLDTELSDAREILKFLCSQDFIDSSRVGVCGLSLGGFIAGITAGDNKESVKSLCMWAPAGNIKDIMGDGISRGAITDDGYYDIGGLILSSKAYESAASLDGLSRTCAFDKRTCIIHGTNDGSVPYEFGIKYRDVMKDTEFYTIDGADHTFNSYEWEKKVIKVTVDFFKRTL